MISTCSTFQSCRLNIRDNLQRQGKCNELYQTGKHILVAVAATEDQPGPVAFLAVTKKFDMPLKTSKYNAKKAVVNSSQSNYTTENYLHITSIIIILNNGYLILKIYVMY